MGPPRRRRAIILGGGHGGVRAARRLLKESRPGDDLEVVMVNKDNVEVWHGLMPQIVGGRVEPSHILVALRTILPGVVLYTHEVKRVDLPNRRVFLDCGGEGGELVLEFDFLVLALGSVTDLARFPGLREHGYQTKTIGDVFHIHNHLLDMLERASVQTDAEERRRLLTFVVAGAGFAGVEIASQANNLIRSAVSFYPTIEESEIRFIVVDRSPRVLPLLSEKLARHATRFMEGNGIEFKLGGGLDSATSSVAILSGGEQIPTRTLIATVGIGPNPVISNLSLATDRGRVVCDEFCRVPGETGVYAIGDNAAILNQRTGEPFPPTAIYAFSQGECAADNILEEIRGGAPKRYDPRRLGDAALLTTNYGLAEVWGVTLKGFLGGMIWRLTIMKYLHGWDRRLAFVMDWLSASVSPPDMAQLRVERSEGILPMRFRAGDTIVREDDAGSRFYIVNHGELEVVRKIPDGGEEQITRLGPGQYFGEVALLYDMRRTATVRALTDATVLSIARQDFNALVEHLPILRETIGRSAEVALPPPPSP